MLIAGDLPDVILVTEVIPKNRVNPITHSLIDIDEYNCFTNFNPEDANLGASGIRGVAIYTRKRLKIEEVKLDVEGCQDQAWVGIKTANGDSILKKAVSIGAHQMMLLLKVANKVLWLSSISSKPLTIEIST